MYISTTASIGQTVYVYSPETDAVTRGIVRAITVQETADSTVAMYRIEGGNDFMLVKDDRIYTSPELAFYRNQIIEPAPAQTELLAA